MHYLPSLQCILAAWSKSVVFLQNIPLLFSLCACLDLYENTSLSPKTFSSRFPSLCLSLWCSHFALSISISFIPPTHSHALFCSVSSLWCSSYTRNITLTLPLCLSHPDTHMHSLSCGVVPYQRSIPSTSVSLSPPLTSLASLWSHQSPSQSPCHSSQLLSSHREKERNVFTPCRSTVISPPVWNDSLVTHSFIGNSL